MDLSLIMCPPKKRKGTPKWRAVLIDAFTCVESELPSSSQFQATRKESIMEEEYEVKYSPLCQNVESAGKEVEVMIYEDGEGGWILEVVDEYSNSTVWDAPFETDQEALNEVMECIKDDGIDDLIGEPPSLH